MMLGAFARCQAIRISGKAVPTTARRSLLLGLIVNIYHLKLPQVSTWRPSESLTQRQIMLAECLKCTALG